MHNPDWSVGVHDYNAWTLLGCEVKAVLILMHSFQHIIVCRARAHRQGLVQ